MQLTSLALFYILTPWLILLTIQPATVKLNAFKKKVFKHSQTLAAIPLFGHIKILNTLIRLVRIALVASAAVHWQGDPNSQ